MPEPSIRSPSRTLRTACSGVCLLLFIVVILPSLGIQTHNTRTQIRVPPHPHGFRSSFRDWCGETAVPREVAEACLAHAVADTTEAAYARSDLLARRRETMEAWGQHVTA